MLISNNLSVVERMLVIPKFLRFFRLDPIAGAASLMVLLLLLAGIFASFVAPYGPYEMSSQLASPPSLNHPLGTDRFGRDVLSRIIFGARISLQVGLSAVIIGSTLGALLGILSGYLRGSFDAVLQRFVDIALSLPPLLVALAICVALGPGLLNVSVAIAFCFATRAIRVTRSAALAVRESGYVEAARIIGLSDWRILFYHVLPNCFAPYLVVATMDLGYAILIEASLSFLGLSIPPPEPSWGSMLMEGIRQDIRTAPWLPIFPGLAIGFTVLSFNLLGDAIRDAWDPRMGRRN